MKAILEEWGLIPSFLDGNDPRPAAEQIDTAYVGGWHSFRKGFVFNPERCTLKHPGDPAMKPISTMIFRTERLHLFECAWVVIEQLDGTWDVARLD